MLELSVKVININLPEEHAILEQCRPLYEYSWFIQKIKDYIMAGLERDDAITLAIKDCEREGIMTEFVRTHGSEAVNMLFTQFYMEDALEANYEEGYEDGIQRGELQKMIQQVSTKLSKGKAADIIADELEEDIEIISKICIAIQESDGLADIKRICEKVSC